MIIGHGDVASVLTDREDIIFFASGVSNSQETREEEYQREENLLMKQDTDTHLVYFGSLSIFYSDTRYAQHKRRMESLIKRRFRTYTIIRIGNITWGKNPNTLINHFKAMAESGEPLDIQDVYRYVVDKDEFLYWIGMIPKWSCEMNVPGNRMKVQDIVDKYVKPFFV